MTTKICWQILHQRQQLSSGFLEDEDRLNIGQTKSIFICQVNQIRFVNFKQISCRHGVVQFPVLGVLVRLLYTNGTGLSV